MTVGEDLPQTAARHWLEAPQNARLQVSIIRLRAMIRSREFFGCQMSSWRGAWMLGKMIGLVVLTLSAVLVEVGLKTKSK
jgi:hypothetical protein